MGTRAVITFVDEGDDFSVYHHWDGDPATVKENIEKAKKYAWTAPRFEASDFAAAYIRANKKEGGGDIYFSHSAEHHDDLAYRYEVSCDDTGGLQVRGYGLVGTTNASQWTRVNL